MRAAAGEVISARNEVRSSRIFDLSSLLAILSAILVFAPAGIVYLTVSRALQVPEAITTVERIGAIADRLRSRES